MMAAPVKVRRGPHRFPHTRVSCRVRGARKVYRCNSIDPAPEHSAKIERGEFYVGVGIRPPKGRPGRWTHVKLCTACALAYELVEPLEALEVTT